MSRHRSRTVTRRILTRAASVAAGAALVAAPAAFAAAPAAVGAGVGHTISPATQQAALAYWTPARLAAARPGDLIRVSRRQLSAAVKQPQAPAGPTGSVGGGSPSGESGPFGPLAGSGVSPADGAFGVPSGDYTRFPYSVNGRIFLNRPGGGGSCSGTSVASYHGTSLEDEVWTAGHCVGNWDGQYPGVWNSSIVFIPAYNGNASNHDPFGKFAATALYTATAWLNNGDPAEDEAAFVVGDNATGQTLGQAVGYDGFAWNASDNENFNQFGYPAATPYNGRSMIQNVASTSVVTGWGSPGQDVIGTPSPMTAGASGGAWDIDWTTKEDGYINGHNDFISGSYPGTMFSPYQDSLTNTIRCFGASSC